MDESTIRHRVSELVEREHELRALVGEGRIEADDEHAELQALEVELDQCWDLLRQRAARRGAGQDPGGATVRPPREVEGYLQ